MTELLTLKEAGVALSVSERTVRRLIDEGELTPVRIRPRSVRVEADEVAALVERRRQPTRLRRQAPSFTDQLRKKSA